MGCRRGFYWICGAIVLATSGFTYAESPPAIQQEFKSLERQDVITVVDDLAKRSKKLHEDALRVWKSYKPGDKPNYSYYFWARNIIFALKKKYKVALNSKDDVAAVFKIMADEKYISKDAVDVLSHFVWENLERRAGMSPLEKIMPDVRREKENITVDQLTQEKQES